MYSESTRRAGRWITLLAALLIILIVFASIGGQILWFWLNIAEFNELYLKPIYYELYAGIILAAIALFRIDFKNRRSIVWWLIPLILRIIRERGYLEAVPRRYFDFKGFKMPAVKFLMWQITKVLLGIIFFRNLFFGMALSTVQQEELSISIGNLPKLITLPFITPPLNDLTYATEIVIPLMPLLTLFVTPILSALGTRLTLLVGLTQILKITTPTTEEISMGSIRIGWRIAVVEGLIALALFWTLINTLFPSNIDYNTRYYIGGLAAGTLIFTALALIDRRGRTIFTSRTLALRIVPILILLLTVGSLMAINNSIADARKVEWLGPYTTQQIAVNRYLAQLDEIKEYRYNFSVPNIGLSDIPNLIERNRDLLSKVRLWDPQAAFAKLKPDIGLIPYVDFADADILRFNGTLYWSASMKPILPKTVRAEDRWFSEHLYYTNVPNGFLMLEGHSGRSVDSSTFFKQRTIYYGESGLFTETWAAKPVNAAILQPEVGGGSYKGKGGVVIDPPISWLFDVNFFWAYRDTPIQVLRYRDVISRVDLLLPYFQYYWGEKTVDIFPVTDGVDTYYMVPLIVALDTRHVPWSVSNPYVRLVGYAFIDVYDGTLHIYVTGEDFLSRIFKAAYQEYIIPALPDVIKRQLRYPEELFEWRISMYNFYHVKDAETFIVAREFFEVPQGLDTYFVIAKPPTFNQTEFVGLLSLELKGAGGRNLAGYMVVRNDPPHLGEMIFYAVPIDSPTKLLGPTAVLEALQKNPEFAQLRTLWGNKSRIGDTIFYQIDEQDIYIIPVYTAGAGGVVTELGVIAAIGAAFTGEYYVGLGSNVYEAYRSFLIRVANVTTAPPPSELTLQELIQQANRLLQSYLEAWSKGRYEEAGRNLEAFLDTWRMIVERSGGG
ncbi:MAG: UPF0182 family protein [Nitrososphaerales archaeon]